MFIFSFYIFLRKKNLHRLQSKIFLLILIDGFVCTIADIGSALMLANVTAYPLFLVNLCNYVYLFLQFSVPVLFGFYFIIVTEIIKRHPKVLIISFIVPYIFGVIALFTNPFTGKVFYYDANMVYTRGFLLELMIYLALVYTVAILGFVIFYRKYIPHKQYPSVILFFLLSMGAVFFQTQNQYFLVQLFAQSIACLFILLTIDNEDDLLNSATGVYNRRTFIQRNQDLQRSKFAYRIMVIKFLNEKYYESVLGVTFMQNVLRFVMRYVGNVVGDVHSVYDCENANFAIIFEKTNKYGEKHMLETLYNKFSSDIVFKDISIAFKVQLCLIHFPKDVTTVENLLTLIDSSEDRVEERVVIIQEDHLYFLQRRTAVENAIQKALRNNSFQVHYQPIWDCKTKKIHSAEALVRLIDDDLGFISPEEFIPIAEKNGTIAEIGRLVFDDVCRLISEEKLLSKGIKFIEVNLSVVQCMHRNLATLFKEILEKYSLSSSVINLEITESSAINSFETFSATMQDLRNLGFEFSLDDYGTDHAEASYIFNMDFSIVKIDKGILWQAEKKSSAKIFFLNTVRMLKEIGLKIVVEGVETATQKDIVSSLGCDYCQGYYFSKPLPKEKFIEYCANYKPENY